MYEPSIVQWLLHVPPVLTSESSTFWPYSVFMCCWRISEKTAIISLYSINCLVFISETESVYCAVRTGSLYVKVKWFPYRPRVAEGLGRVIALLFLDRGTRRGLVVSSTPRLHFAPGKDPVPILQEAGWAPGPVWIDAENLVPTGIRSRTVQLVVSRYTDWATRPTGTSG